MGAKGGCFLAALGCLTTLQATPCLNFLNFPNYSNFSKILNILYFLNSGIGQKFNNQAGLKYKGENIQP